MVLRGTDRFDERDGTPVYENRYVIWAATRWGLIRDCADTEKSTAFDAYLADKSSVAADGSAVR